MNFIEIKTKQISYILKKKNKKKNKTNFYKVYFIKIKNNIKINNFLQINFLKKKKKIFFFPINFMLDNIKVKKNINIVITNIFIL